MRKDSQITTYTDTSLRDDQFALILMDKTASITYKMLPVSSKADIESSVNEFLQYRDTLTEEEQKVASYFLKEACLTRSIVPDSVLTELSKEVCETNTLWNREIEPEVQKQAYQHYALGGQYAIDTEGNIREAVRYFDRFHEKLGSADRREFAVNTFRRARELGIDIDESDLAKFACNRIDSNSAYQNIEYRKSFCKEAGLADMYDKLYDNHEHLMPEQFVELLEILDKKSGITPGFYPHQNVVGAWESILPKSAAASAFTIEANGRIYTPMQVKSALANPQVSALYGSGMVNQLKQDPAIILSLPKDDQESILSYAL